MLLHHPNIIETIRHLGLVPRLHLQRFGRWSLGTIVLLWLLTAPPYRRHVMPSRLPPRDCVSRPCPSERSNVRLSIALPCVIARAMRGPNSREEGSFWKSTWPKTQRADTSRVLPVALSYVASSLAELRPRIRECPTPRVCVAPRDLGLLIKTV